MYKVIINEHKCAKTYAILVNQKIYSIKILEQLSNVFTLRH